jgi:UDP-N-acetylmuramyl-tripeptide synthetase
MATRDSNEVAHRPTLGALLAGIVEHSLAPAARQHPVTGLFDDSRRVRPGGMFVALRGTTADGRRFIHDALQRGAAVLLGERLQPTAGALVIDVEDARATLARLAARWYGLDAQPPDKLQLLAVTGTNGKTTVVHMTQAILQAAGWRCGLLGTVRYDLCGHHVAAGLTTPGPLELCAHLRRCLDAGAQAVVMELSSHALDQRRTDGLHFGAAAFTNLTQDHLDYHVTLAAYRAAKARLFAGLDSDAVAVVNADDPSSAAMLADCRARVVRYALDRDADLTASIKRDTLAGTLYELRVNGRELVLENGLVGRHNVYNALAAAGLARALDVPTDAIERGLSTLRSVPGRLQRVPGAPDTNVFVDYAHTPDALRNAASVLKTLARKRLIVVFGCGGDRDRAKRPLMTRAAAEFGDVLVITADNPRREEPRRIIDDMLEGLESSIRRRVLIEPDRRQAIRGALAGAASGDVVLIAGKGHENCQIVGDERLPFDDVAEVTQALAELDTETARRSNHARD